MKTGEPPKFGIGWIIVDCFLFFEFLKDIRRGRITLNGWCMIVMASAILGMILVAVLKKRIRNSQVQVKPASTEEKTDPDDTGECLHKE